MPAMWCAISWMSPSPTGTIAMAISCICYIMLTLYIAHLLYYTFSSCTQSYHAWGWQERATVLEADRRAFFPAYRATVLESTAARAEVEKAMKQVCVGRLWGDQRTELKTKTKPNTTLLWRKGTSKGLPPTTGRRAVTARELNPHTYRLSFVTANSHWCNHYSPPLLHCRCRHHSCWRATVSLHNVLW